MTDIAVLSASETEAALADHRHGKTSSMLAQIATELMKVVDTKASVWVVGMKDSTINSLRTRMYRRDVVITVRKIRRDAEIGHVITARTIHPSEQG
jgi:16S rRNA G1207 methylase RsmC